MPVLISIDITRRLHLTDLGSRFADRNRESIQSSDCLFNIIDSLFQG